ncbi:FkbM family methyltransferase [Sphingomonas sp. HF-S3]|uniref:FkbM family methyltransferase n=1 Tax=Sphingomonas rustica TaxID=3103142 RepID=A0ABV0BCK9_9SPHN
MCRTIRATGWERIPNPALGADALRTYRFGEPLVLMCSAETTALQFLAHEWSGAVIIKTDAGSELVSLSRDHGGEIVEARLPKHDRDFEVSIESIAVSGREPERCEAWLLGVMFDGVAQPVSRSLLLNQWTKIVYGDWGEFLVLASDEVIPGAIVREGAWAPRDIELFQQHIGEGDVVLDVGANFGHHSVVFSKLVGDAGRVIAIEAQSLMYRLVHANAALNRRYNILPIHAAAGAEEGSVTMFSVDYDGDHNFGALAVDTENDAEDARGERVAVHTLDTLLPQHLEGRPVRFVKIDVQAYELYVLKGMAETISRDRPTIFIEISPYWMRRAGYDYVEIYDFLRARGYDFIHRDGIVPGPNGVPEVAEDDKIEWDLLAVPQAADKGQAAEAP